MVQMPRDQVFISYSHKDKRWLDTFLIHLRPHTRDGSISFWSDKQIQPGSKWLEQIRAALDRTKLAVLLVTPNFLASDFVQEHELTPMLAEAETGGVSILWIPVRASSYEKSPIAEYQALIDPARPLAQMKAERDAAWVQICESITKALKASLSSQVPETKSIIGEIKPPITIRHRDVQPLPHRPLLRDLERSMTNGELQNSFLAQIIYGLLSEESAVEVLDPYEPAWLINAIRLSDEYFVRVHSSAGTRDWQRDLAQIATPILVGLSKSLKRSPEVQALLIRVCNVLASQLRLELVWPLEPDDYNDLVNAIYAAGLGASEIESDEVLVQLKGLVVVGPKKL
jgi:TIR domain